MTMRVPWKWLKEYVDVPWEPEEAAKQLTMIGLEVENLSREVLDVSRVVSARILQVSPHPGREDLKVGILDAGGKRFSVVSSAPGFLEGNVVLLAKPGATLPGGRIIEVAEVGGVFSEGMVVCSNEVLLGQDPRPFEDIIVLPGDTTPGIPVQELCDLDDYVLDLDLTVNYSHCLSVLGVALEASALSGQPLVLPEVLSAWDWAGPTGSCRPGPREQGQFSQKEERLSRAEPLEISVELPDRDLCPRYVGKIVRNVTYTYAPLVVERRLLLAGMRPVNAIVDATNYVMFETGQPLHAFDFDKLNGRVIRARRSRQGEFLRTIDGEVRMIDPGTLVIADSSGPVAIAGVMGGMETEVTPDTRNILIESAWFNPLSVRLTSQKLRLRTEAAVRFEKGVDPTGQGAAAERAACLIADFAGGQPQAGMVECKCIGDTSKTIVFRTCEVGRSLGLSVPKEECRRIFCSLGFDVRDMSGRDGEDGQMCVTVPPRRVDIKEEVDLIEEVARHHGFHRFQEENLPSAVPGGSPGELARVDRLKDLLSSLGGLEVVTSSLLSPGELEALGWDRDDPRGNPVFLKNPLSSYESCLRPSLLPGLLKVLGHNQKQRARGLVVWEMGRVFFPAKDDLPDSLPLEIKELALASYGTVHQGSWMGDERGSSFYHLKGLINALLDLLNVHDPVYLPRAGMPFHPGKSARIVVGSSTIGEIGEMHPKCQADLDLTGLVTMAWFSLEALLSLSGEKPYVAVPRFMPVERDLSVVVPDEVPAGAVLDRVRRTAKSLEEVMLFDIWRKPPVPKGAKSLAMRLIYQPRDRTLTEEELSEDRRRILEALERDFEAKLRV